MEAIYSEFRANIILTGERLKASTLQTGTKQRCPLSLLLFHRVLEVLAEQSKYKEIKRHPSQRGRNKIPFADANKRDI